MGTERFWQQALAQSEAALAASALVPLATRLESLNGESGVIFEIRHLTGVPPVICALQGRSRILFGPGIPDFRWTRSTNIMS